MAGNSPGAGEASPLADDRAAIEHMLEIARTETVVHTQRCSAHTTVTLHHLKESTARLTERREEVNAAHAEVCRLKEEHLLAVAVLHADREELTALQLAFAKEKEEFERRAAVVKERDTLCESLQQAQARLREELAAVSADRDHLHGQLMPVPLAAKVGVQEAIANLARLLHEHAAGNAAEHLQADILDDRDRLEALVARLQQENEMWSREVPPDVAFNATQPWTGPPDSLAESEEEASWSPSAPDLDRLEDLVARLQADKEDLRCQLEAAVEDVRRMCGISPPATSMQVMVGTRSWVSDLDLEQPLLVAKLERERDAARMEAEALRQDSLGAQAELTRLLQEIQALSASEAELRHRLDAAEAQKRDAELAHQEAQTTADASHALLQSQLSALKAELLAVLDLNNTIEIEPRGSSAHEPIHEPVEQSEVTTQTDEDGMEAKLHALRCEQAELLEGTQHLRAENDGLRKRVADLEAVKPTAETIGLETAPGPEDPSALLAQREQEIRLLMTALTEANRRFEALGCRRVEVDDESHASRSHPGTVAGLRIHNLRRTWSDSPSNHAGVYVPSRLLHRPPQDTEASHLKSTSTSSANTPQPFRAVPMPMRLPLGSPPRPLDPRTAEQFREIPITLGYLLHLKLSFQAADTDQQGALDLIKLGRWCVKVGYVDIAFSHLQSMIEQVDVTRTGTVAFWPFFAIQSHLHLNLGAKGHPLRDWLTFVTSPPTTRRASEPLHGVVSPIRPASARRLREHGPDT